ncbi:MAG: peptidylprolyl isomerase, partial [Candidatus Omnitrophica bacterium]|nr:peptidylprolyl isomerase [Candidatus Omnitrophota bacterium]
PTPHLNNHHTIFGEVKEGQEVVDSIAQGDKIESLNIIGEIEDFVAEMNDRIGSWNAILDRN